jgi:hypothetical protein
LTAQESVNDLFPILFLAFLAFLLWTAGNLRQKYRPRPIKAHPISRRQIESIVYKKYLLYFIPICGIIPLLMILLYMVGRITPGTAFISSLVILLIPAWNLYVFMYLQWRPLKTLPDEIWFELEQTLANETLQRVDGAWQFQNQDWYIRVSNSECTLLCAKYINFKSPIRNHTVFMSSNGYKNTSIRIRSQELLFTTHTNSIIRARIQQTIPITKWVKNHGGRFE